MIKNIFNKIKPSSNSDKDTSIKVNQKKVDNITKHPDFPFLISFPRTGSHWLRMIMELYFEKPSLVRIFYKQNKKAKSFTCYHRHDLDLEIQRNNVLYLYRHPVPTIYSQLNYHKEDFNNDKNIIKWAELYGKHLSKWLIEENFTEKKTILTYEGLQNDIYTEFEKVCKHFDMELDEHKLGKILPLVSKENLKKKTKHDKDVVNLEDSYKNNRKDFIENKSQLIFDTISRKNNNLRIYFNLA